jgi:hypothetical protein
VIRRSATAAFATVALSAIALTAFAPQSQAVGSFDGKWSVVIMTTKGDCDRAYRYPIAITGATLINLGDAAFDISGKVQGNGAVTVRVSYGQKSAAGTGRLSATFGTGSWSGGECSGTWTAERRG